MGSHQRDVCIKTPRYLWQEIDCSGQLQSLKPAGNLRGDLVIDMMLHLVKLKFIFQAEAQQDRVSRSSWNKLK